MVANKIFHNNERKLSNGEENSDSSGQKRESGKLFSSMKVLCPWYGQKRENSSKAPRQLNSVGNAINSRQGQNGAIFQIFGQQWKNK